MLFLFFSTLPIQISKRDYEMTLIYFNCSTFQCIYLSVCVIIIFRNFIFLVGFAQALLFRHSLFIPFSIYLSLSLSFSVSMCMHSIILICSFAGHFLEFYILFVYFSISKIKMKFFPPLGTNHSVNKFPNFFA